MLRLRSIVSSVHNQVLSNYSIMTFPMDCLSFNPLALYSKAILIALRIFFFIFWLLIFFFFMYRFANIYENSDPGEEHKRIIDVRLHVVHLALCS